MYLLHDRPNRPDFSGKSIAVPQTWQRVVSPCSPQLHAPPVLLTQCTRIIVVAGHFARRYCKLSLSSSLIFSFPNHEFDVQELLADELLIAEPNQETRSPAWYHALRTMASQTILAFVNTFAACQRTTPGFLPILCLDCTADFV